MPSGWGLISTGTHAERSVAPAMAQAADSEFVAIYSRHMARAEDFAAKHGIKAAYDTLDDLLSDSRMDSVFICSPDFLHASYTIQAANAKKNVLVEKPMAISVPEAIEMVRECRRNGVTLGVAYPLRTQPLHMEAKRQVGLGVLGTPTMAQAQWSFRSVAPPGPFAPTGLGEWSSRPEMIGHALAMMKVGVHAIDLLQFLLGERITEVAAITDGQTSDQPLEDTAALSLRFQGGALGTMCCGRRLYAAKNDVILYGTRGRIMDDALQGSLEIIDETGTETQSFPHEEFGLVRREIEAFNAAVQQGQEPPATGIDGLSVVQVISAAIESASTGRRAHIEPVTP